LKLLDYIRPLILKILLLYKNNSKKIKSPSANAKEGLELASSPYWTRSELLIGVRL